MEYMRLEGFLGRAVSRLVNKALETKVGFNPNLDIQGLKVDTGDDEDFVRVNCSVIMSRNDFEKVIEEVTK